MQTNTTKTPIPATLLSRFRPSVPGRDAAFERPTRRRPRAGRRSIARVVVAVGLALIWSGLPGRALAHGPTVEVSHEALKPTLLNLFVGTTVHFANTVEMPGGHTIVDEAGTLESPRLEKPGDGWHYTFEEVGTFEIFIREHPDAKARIVVVPKR